MRIALRLRVRPIAHVPYVCVSAPAVPPSPHVSFRCRSPPAPAPLAIGYWILLGCPSSPPAPRWPGSPWQRACGPAGARHRARGPGRGAPAVLRSAVCGARPGAPGARCAVRSRCWRCRCASSGARCVAAAETEEGRWAGAVGSEWGSKHPAGLRLEACDLWLMAYGRYEHDLWTACECPCGLASGRRGHPEVASQLQAAYVTRLPLVPAPAPFASPGL
jgi:hypothetical protein